MKRFLLVTLGIFFGVLLVGFLATKLFGREILGYALRPDAPFDPASAPAAPDYREASAWAALPGTEDPADLRPAGEAAPEGPRDVDVFFVHPTTYYAPERWSGPLDDARVVEMTDLTLAGQASVFNRCCRVFAPRYRQAAIGAYLEADESSLAAFRLAYADVKVAFAAFLARRGEDRPFILAAHSQGTMHAARLLEEEIQGTPLQDRLVAAYLVGYRLPLALLETRLGSVPVCAGPEATGCLVGWDTHSEEGDPGFEIPYVHWKGDRLESTQGVPRLCVNPISWRPDEAPAPAADHLGAVTVETAEPFPGMMAMFFTREVQGIEITGLGAPRPGRFGARCQGSRLLIPPRPEPYETMNAGGSYHIFDYDLFYADVRQNAVDRVAAFLAARAAPALEADGAPAK